MPGTLKISDIQNFQNVDAESLIYTYLGREHIQISNKTNGCYYIPSIDFINMVPFKHFNSSEEYYSTFFHEINQSTEVKTRLNKLNFSNDIFGSKAYSEEELVAEISASYICNFLRLQTPDLITNSIAFLEGWSRKLKNDKMFFYKSIKKPKQRLIL